MQMMPWVMDTGMEGAVYTLIIVVSILGLISVFLSYMILNELKDTKKALERMEKLLSSVE